MNCSSERKNLKIRDKSVENTEDLDNNHLNKIMGANVLLPFMHLDEIFQHDAPNGTGKSSPLFINPIKNRKPISIETSLIYGEPDRFYYIIDPNKEINPEDDEDLKNCEIIGIDVINITYENVECSMIIFKKWTMNFRF